MHTPTNARIHTYTHTIHVHMHTSIDKHTYIHTWFEYETDKNTFATFSQICNV